MSGIDPQFAAFGSVPAAASAGSVSIRGGDVGKGLGIGGAVSISSGLGRGFESGSVVLQTAPAPQTATHKTSTGSAIIRTGSASLEGTAGTILLVSGSSEKGAGGGIRLRAGASGGQFGGSEV